MRITSIELAWFRGAADPVSLELNSKSMVIYGANGSGKSSFVDAIEYVLNSGIIEHLKNEYSGTRQVKALPNTHRPQGGRTYLGFKFKDKSAFTIDFASNGSSESSGGQDMAMANWEYRQTVLRQDEISKFIHDTKGGKYSALLPLFGLQGMEFSAENFRKLAQAVESESKLGQKVSQLNEVERLRKETFETQDYEEIVDLIHNLYVEYCEENPAISDPLALCNELDKAIDNQIGNYSADNQQHIFLREVATSSLEANVQAVRAFSVDLAGSLEPHITEQLGVLGSATLFVDSLVGIDIVDCPACGQSISVDAFRQHVKEESDRLNDINKTFTKYKAAIGTVCSSLDSLKFTLDKPSLKAWRNGLDDADIIAGFEHLAHVPSSSLRESCTEEDLSAIDTKLLPIVAIAARDSSDAPSDVRKLTDDKKLLDVAKSVIATKDLDEEIKTSQALVALMRSLEQKARTEIRQQSQRVIDSISKDLETMWEILHPGENIDAVRLLLPPDTDKAIDVVLKFHGVEQDSPRLTLSEGYRNSLGLCIFLAMAKQVADTERPLFLDDVVVSLDRNHRGMILELLEREFSDRQVIILTHDREWYTELRHQLEHNNKWLFKTLLPFETPETGIRWSRGTTTFGDARALLQGRPDAAASDARRIMDVELPMIAEHLKIRLPYLRSDKNDRRMAHEFLSRLVADGKRCFQKNSASGYVENSDALESLTKADKLLRSWGNRAAHSSSIVPSEASELIDACENALAVFWCDSCDPPSRVWILEDSKSKSLQCRCGALRWK